MRIRNEHLRRLLDDVFNQRPVYAKPPAQLTLRKIPGIRNLRDPGTDWCHAGLGRRDWRPTHLTSRNHLSG